MKRKPFVTIFPSLAYSESWWLVTSGSFAVRYPLKVSCVAGDLTGRKKMKTGTRKALFISLIFHLLFFIATFYVAVQNQPIASEKVPLALELLSAEKSDQSKRVVKKAPPRFRAPTRELLKPLSPQGDADESLRSLAAPVPVVPETPRPALGRDVEAEVEESESSTALDISEKNWNAVSTAARTLRDIKSNLAQTEAASPAGNKTFGAKRPGPPRIQRTPEIAPIKILEEEVNLSPAQLAEIRENRKSLPRIPFSNLMQKLARDIVETSQGAPIDVVFVIDASGSMGDNIESVVEHLKEMVDVYKASKKDYALGVTEFWATKNRNRIKVVQLTKSFTDYKRTLQAINVHDDENALDAVVQTVKELRFRPTSKRHFILVTDEPFTSVEGLEVEDVIAYCQEFGVYVNVLGLPLDEHLALAAKTGGRWYVIPEKVQPQVVQRTRVKKTQQSKVRSLRYAQWTEVGKIGNDLLQHGSNTPVDIILFVDSSKSMDTKLPHFLEQLNLLVRHWGNALIDYQIGVVRFRSRASVNIVNVFNPPQTLEQIRKIVGLPCQADEMLLDAVAEGLRRLKFRPNAQPYFILITDEPASGAYSPLAIIDMLQQKQVPVSVVGTYDDFQQQVADKTGGVWVPIPEGHTTNNLYW